MFDRGKQVFCHRLVRREKGVFCEGLSPRYTIMTLLGLHELEQSGGNPPFDIKSVYESFVTDTKWIHSAGDLGLLVWLISAFAPDQVEGVIRSVNLDRALDHYPDAREGRSMELAWFLMGLAHAAETSPKIVSRLTDLAVETYHRLEENQGEHGFFGHLHSSKSLAGRIRGRFGSFADQIYPIYAFSKFALAFHVEEPLGPALECATAISRAQGELGQWWWLYDARNGRVASHYPVYSVHQHGMAPMGLFAIQEATGQSFESSIHKGLRWVYGTNELGVDMRDCQQKLIWRCLRPRNKGTKYWDMALSIVRPKGKAAQPPPLAVLYEQRPYEFGWLLFAFAKSTRTAPVPAAV